MFEASLTIGGTVLAIILWWLQNRAKSKKELERDEIRKQREARDEQIDSWLNS